jgi:nicotinate-nucleotide--dimethylbenzimidazole phosphoribosyltransferase
VLIIAAGDHGVAGEGVSAYPSEVTQQMVANFVRGGAAANALARVSGTRVVVADFGVASERAAEGTVDCKIAPGTRNLVRERAMTREQAVECIVRGFELAQTEARQTGLFAIGEMGIANTTPAAAITACMCEVDPALVTGRGTGVDDAGFAHKVEVVRAALTLHCPDSADALDVLSAVGGFEIGGLAGVILGAAASRCPVIVDGFITGAAALLATTLCPAAREFLLPSHCSVEPGHQVAMAKLGLAPLFDLQMRLGEGTGALLAVNVVRAAVAALNEMATFDEAAVSGPSE